ncbi:MAG: S-layer homology domain-containing protein [Oscillospiraceae bacterium]|nr:S-layer homology domain-containing protein [Oscillospiraceae bacterium]
MQLNLNAAAYVNGEVLISNDTLFDWEIEGDIGTITEDGIFTLADTVNQSGKIKVRAGNSEKTINVYISDYPKPVNPFADTDGHWAETVLSLMSYRGVINGIEEDGQTVFKPDDDMTRAEFASMISNYLNLDLSDYGDAYLEFADSGEIPLWAQGCVGAMYEEGIILGKSNDDGTVTFNPCDKITRAEAMTILGRLIDSEESAELTFADADEIPEWARESMSKLLSAGIISGYSDNTILPNNNVKRAEAVNMLYKFQ